MIADLDVAAVVDGMAQPVTLLRYAAPTIAAGRASYAAPTSSTIAALVVPLSGRELDRLPEGVRQRARFAAFTTSTVRTASQEIGVKADELVFEGETWACEQEQGYRQVGGFARLILTKAEP